MSFAVPMKPGYELKHIVYVDDDEEDRIFFSEALAAVNSKVVLTVFETGYQLIDFLRKINDHDQLPTSIICDMKMPLMNGIDLVKHLKEEPLWENIPAVIFSTSSNLRDSNNSMQCGAIAFFSKPNTFEELKLAVREILELCSDTLAMRLQTTSTT